MNTAVKFRTRLTLACDGPIYISETDAPIVVFEADAGGDLTPSAIARSTDLNFRSRARRQSSSRSLLH